MKLRDDFVKQEGWDWRFSVVVKSGTLMLPQFPRPHFQELEAISKAGGWPRDLLIFGNVIPDLRKLTRCSALVVEPERSATGGCLFGRNLDWDSPRVPLHELVLVTVYRPTGKHAFVSVGFPGLIGCVSGMNDAGLALAELTVNASADGAPYVDTTGVPFTLALRRVLEDCTTIEEAERLLRSIRRTTMENFAFCDQRDAAVFEVTSKHLCVRHASDGLSSCTNDFLTKELTLGAKCPRYAILDKTREMKRVALADLVEKLDAVASDSTLETMVFEPGRLKLHLGFGPGPASQLPLHEVELSTLLKNGQFPPDRKLSRNDRPVGPPRVTKGERGSYQVEFRYRPVGRANAVHLAGTFNEWSRTAQKMEGPDENGYYQATLHLAAGRYEYKFVIDGKVWRRDPHNDAQAGFYRNSVIEVGR